MSTMTARDMLSYELERDYSPGRLLELNFYDQLAKLPNIKNILHESQLRRLYGWYVSSIDFLIEYDNGIVLVQCKYRNTRRRENYGINNFLRSIDVIKKQYAKPLLFGLWISRLDPFEDNKSRLQENNILTVSNFTSLDGLINSAVSVITQLYKPAGLDVD